MDCLGFWIVLVPASFEAYEKFYHLHGYIEAEQSLLLEG